MRYVVAPNNASAMRGCDDLFSDDDDLKNDCCLRRVTVLILKGLLCEYSVAHTIVSKTHLSQIFHCVSIYYLYFGL